MVRKGKHLTLQERFTIERMLIRGYSKKSIADAIGCSLATVYNEIKRATYIHTNSDLTEEIRYAPEIAHAKYLRKLKTKRWREKLKEDGEQLKYILNLILENDWSPSAALLYIKRIKVSFDVPIKSVNTIYRGIAKGYFPGLTLEMLPEGGRHRRRKQRKKVNKVQKRLVNGKSIEMRDESILLRSEFGHWEMDTVHGKQGTKKTILSITERKTEYEFLESLSRNTIDEVRRALNKIEKEVKSLFNIPFRDIFKTITVDNGSEFLRPKAIEKSCIEDGNRTEVYYCHPYTPQERGTNEINNKMVRRVFAKGSNFDKSINRRGVKRCQNWMNTYPRKILNGETSEMRFMEEIKKLQEAARQNIS